MKKLNELRNAILYIPKLFHLVYRTDRLYLFYMIGETLAFASMQYPAVLLSKYALDAMQTNRPFVQFTIVCSAFILLQLAISLIKSLFNNLRPSRELLVKGRLYNAFHRKCMELDYELLAEKEIQELLSFAGEFIENKLNDTVWKFISLFSSLIAFIVSCVLLTAVNFWLILAAIVGLLLDSVVLTVIIPKRFTLNKQLSADNRYIRYHHELATSEDAAKDVRIFDMANSIIDRTSKKTRDMLVLEKQKNRLDIIQSILNLLTSHGTNWLVYMVLGLLALNGELSIGSLSLSIGNLSLFRKYFEDISETLVGYTETAKHIEYYNRFMELESQFHKTGIMPLEMKKEEAFQIEFRNVFFRYPGQTEYTLENFNLIIKSGEKISVIGENGAGKSTFVKLLMRLYDPSAGEILFNGVDIKQFNYEQYLSIFAPIFQDYKLFAFTVRENISAFEESDLPHIIEAAQRSGIDHRIQELPHKYDTYLTKQFDEDGLNFSGGEQQKIAIARTYFKSQALITILDEPTSALDIRAERTLYKHFNDLIGANTAFFISHRLSSSKFCDKIIVIKKKRVAEYGSHKELMAKKGDYYALYSMQASYYQS